MTFYGENWAIDDVLTFYVNTHDPDTGSESDTDSVPSYRVYENETGTAILTGSMAKLDDSNTTGFYSEAVTLSAANGFEAGKCYAIRVAGTFAAGSPDTTGIEVIAFRMAPTYAEPGQGAPAATTTLATKIGHLYKLARNRKTQTATQFSLYADDGTTVDQKSTVSDDGTTFDAGELATGP